MKSMFVRYGAALAVALSYKGFYIALSSPTLYLSYFISNIFLTVEKVGNSLLINGVTFSLIPACTAASAYLLLALLILTTRGIDFRKGTQMFFLGSSALLVFNSMRIFSLIEIYFQFGKNYFDAVHLFVWYVVSTVVVVTIWIILTRMYKIKSIPIYTDMKQIRQQSVSS